MHLSVWLASQLVLQPDNPPGNVDRGSPPWKRINRPVGRESRAILLAGISTALCCMALKSLLSLGAAFCWLISNQFFVDGSPTSKGFDWNDVKYVYAFGDSYSFVQGTAGLANFSFIGDAFDFSFSQTELLKNEIIPKNTSSDGSNWLEFLTGCFEGRPSDCHPHQLWDFSFAGADIDKSLLPLHHNFTVDLVGQVQQWAQYASSVLPRTPASATLTAWWIGINDTGDVLGHNITDFAAFWREEMASYFGAVELAYAHGLRGAYLFVNVPPEDRSPNNLGKSSAPAIAARIEEYNAALAAHVEDFAQSHPDMNVMTFDAHTWFNDILDNAQSYGFHNTTGFCECRDPSYFWYNVGHPTEHVHRLLAQAIEAQLLSVRGTT
ncbi:hypothetical protein DENSPDRAFT_835557 [Dentipellis sp. KUC8613]|nr:hypothetical protein DENSPDRAFT_835557 [Dentipellis sp. KUC8613]